MTNLPFIGKLNTVFIVAVSIGMGIILLTMVLNIINSLRDHDPEKHGLTPTVWPASSSTRAWSSQSFYI